MRTNEDMLKAVHSRAAEMRRQKRRRQNILLGGGAAVFALAVIALLAANMPAVTERLAPENAAGMQASILTGSGMLGYAVVGILAFLLGVSVTVFCGLLRNRRDEEEKDHDRDR